MAQRAPLVRSNVSGEKNGERIDAVHKVRPTLWSVSLFLAVQPFIVETLKMVRCSLLHSLGFLAGGRSESSLCFWLD